MHNSLPMNQSGDLNPAREWRTLPLTTTAREEIKEKKWLIIHTVFLKLGFDFMKILMILTLSVRTHYACCPADPALCVPPVLGLDRICAFFIKTVFI